MDMIRRALGICAITSFFFTAAPAFSQDGHFGGALPGHPEDNASVQIDRLIDVANQKALELGIAQSVPAPPSARSDYIKLQYPLKLSPSAKGNTTFHISNFMDQDSSSGIQDWACNARTYNGHGGIDIFPSVSGWWRMDQGNQQIVAAAPGTILLKNDGEQDRRCGTLETAGNFPANYVIINQDDGLYGIYYHMKKNSVTSRAVGQRVKAGDYLGLVGSSGFTTGPHLHFELRTPSGTSIDPFEGTCSAATSIWSHQWDAHDNFAITEVATHSAPPTFASCTNGIAGQDTPNFEDTFNPGDTVYFAMYLRDLAGSINVKFEVFDPSGTRIRNYTFDTPSGLSYYSSYWYYYSTFSGSSANGKYRYRVTADGKVAEGAFFIGPKPADAGIFSSLQPTGRSVQSGSTATVFSNLINHTANTAYNCGIYPETPMAGEFWFQTTDPATNLLNGERNAHVDIAPGAVQTFALGFTPETGFQSTGAKINLRYKCANSDAAPLFDGVNVMNLTFENTAVADIIPIIATASNDGVLRTGGTNVTATYYASAVNIGSSATINVSSFVPTISGITSSLCEIDGAGNCVGPQGGNINVSFAPNVVKFFKVNFNSTATIAFDPSSLRAGIRFIQSGKLRGESSVAVTTQ